MPTRRRRASARSKTPPWGWIAAGAAAVGAGAYLLFKPGQAQAAALPPGPAPAPTPPPPVPQPTVTPPPVSRPTATGPNGPDPSPALVSRLRSSDQARQIFALQAMFYEYGFTSAPPDGVEGPVTDGLIRQINQFGSFGTEPNRYTSRSLANAAAVLAQRYGGVSYRMLPFTLPQDVIQAVNDTQARVAPGSYIPLLQVLPTVPPSQEQQFANAGAQGALLGNAGRVLRPAGRVQEQAPTIGGRPVRPAGQVIAAAGYDRPLTVQPTNTVSSNPGLGVLTDPNGLNIGLWEATEGWMHTRNGTGVVAADVQQNPVAGQPGGYWAGYR